MPSVATENSKQISLFFGQEMKLKCVNIVKHVFPMRLLFKVLVARGNIKDWLFDENFTVLRFTGSCLLIAIIYRLVRKYIFKRKYGD